VSSRRRSLLALAALALFAPARARANGAFPDSLSILLPRDKPDEITLATNFGLVFTADGGRTWEWTCEHDSSLGAILYQLGPPPRDTMFALGLDLVRSEDEGCVWTPATGRVAKGFLFDLFADPTNGDRVLAVANPNDETPARVHVFESMDGGATFPTSLFEAEVGFDISGLELPAADPSILYLTWASSKSGELRSGIIRLRDRGTTIDRYDHFTTLQGNPLGIATVDRKDARKIFLRAFGTEHDRLAISEDGGATVRVALEVSRSLVGFVQREDGVLFAAARDVDGGTLFVSRDEGKTFTAQTGVQPRFRALGGRGSRLYAAGDDAADGFALGASDDDGRTWQPLLHFKDVERVKSCPGTGLPQACGPSCIRLSSIELFRPQVCSFYTPPDAAPSDAAMAPPSPGCHCGVGGRAGTSGLPLAFVALAAIAAVTRSRRRCDNLPHSRRR